jgi:hypothetical protein
VNFSYVICNLFFFPPYDGLRLGIESGGKGNYQKQRSCRDSFPGAFGRRGFLGSLGTVLDEFL